MKADNLKKIEAELANCEYFSQLADCLYGFTREDLHEEQGDCYEICRYANDAIKRGICLYFHEETKEYKLKVWIGLTEFCVMEFIAGSLDEFIVAITHRLDGFLEDLSRFNPEHISILVKNTGVLEWDYHEVLPSKIGEFELFVNPHQPVRIINGSYIIANYVNFRLESDLVIYYNIYRDEFFGEIRPRRIPEIKYEFDSPTLADLEIKLKEHLALMLKELAER